MLLLDVFIAPPPVGENKFETAYGCMSAKIPIKLEWKGDSNNTAKKSWYTYSSLRVVEVIVLTLEFLITWCDRLCDIWRMNEFRQKYPKIEKSIRIQQPKTLDSNICPTYTGMGCGTLACICRNSSSIFPYSPKIRSQKNSVFRPAKQAPAPLGSW